MPEGFPFSDDYEVAIRNVRPDAEELIGAIKREIWPYQRIGEMLLEEQFAHPPSLKELHNAEKKWLTNFIKSRQTK